MKEEGRLNVCADERDTGVENGDGGSGMGRN